jgi:hypothetical protein
MFLKQETEMQRLLATLTATFLFIGLCVFLPATTANSADGKVYSLEKTEHGKVLKTADGRTVFQYMTRKPAGTNLSANSTCCLFPLNTPEGIRVVDFAPGDHRHHRGVFLAWHAMEFSERADFWGWGEMAPTAGCEIVNRDISLVATNHKSAQLAIRNQWMIKKRVRLEEQLTINVQQQEEVFVIDMHFQLTPTTDLTIDRTAFGGFCVKSRQDGKGVFFNPQGKVSLPPPHHLKPETDWPSSPWYDYTIALADGQTAGIAVMNHPENPATKWHNLISIAMINPCIVANGPLKLKKDQTLSLRYRLVVHDGRAPEKLLQTLSSDWRGSE